MATPLVATKLHILPNGAAFALIWMGEALMEVDPRTYEPLSDWPTVDWWGF